MGFIAQRCRSDVVVWLFVARVWLPPTQLIAADCNVFLLNYIRSSQELLSRFSRATRTQEPRTTSRFVLRILPPMLLRFARS